jgi:hypothetical protein
LKNANCLSLFQVPALPKGTYNQKSKRQNERFEGEFLHFQPSGPVFVISWCHSQRLLLLFA